VNHDCTRFFDIEGMTYCSMDISSCWDELEQYCYFTIDGVDSEGPCPDYSTGSDSYANDEDEDIYSDDWDMTYDDENIYTDEDCNDEYDCMTYYDVEGMTYCFELESCDSTGYYMYYCYLTIDGVDSEGVCPDEWTVNDMSDDDWETYDDEEDMTYDDEEDMTYDDSDMSYEDECGTETVVTNCQMWSDVDMNCVELIFSYDTCDMSE